MANHSSLPPCWLLALSACEIVQPDRLLESAMRIILKRTPSPSMLSDGDIRGLSMRTCRIRRSWK